MNLIDKTALVAEIERRRKLVSDPILSGNDLMIGERNALFNLLSFIDTLEVKEVDLDNNIREYLTNYFNVYEDGVLQSKKNSQPLSTYDIINVAKHFFELGFKAQKGE